MSKSTVVKVEGATIIQLQAGSLTWRSPWRAVSVLLKALGVHERLLAQVIAYVASCSHHLQP